MSSKKLIWIKNRNNFRNHLRLILKENKDYLAWKRKEKSSNKAEKKLYKH